MIAFILGIIRAVLGIVMVFGIGSFLMSPFTLFGHASQEDMATARLRGFLVAFGLFVLIGIILPEHTTVTLPLLIGYLGGGFVTWSQFHRR